MDPFEEFEFKPLTDGLGFHKKKSPINTTTPTPELFTTAAPKTAEPKAQPAKQQKIFVDRGLDLLDEEPSFRSPLPRKTFQINPAPTIENSTTAAVDEILKTLKQNRRLEIEDDKKQITALKNPTNTQMSFKPSALNLAAAVLDGMLMIAAFLLCMIAMLIITKVDLLNNLMNPDTEGMIYLSTALVFVGVSFVYLTVNRLFLGCTPGEWAYDQMIGLPEEQNKISYALKVVSRVLLVMATGFITLPVLSLIMNKDIAGLLTGAKLVKKA